MKQTRMLGVVLLGAMVTASGDAPAASTLRCGHNIVSTGQSAAYVLSRCGEPAYRSVLSGGQGSRGTLVEQWTYSQGRGHFLKILRFQGGILVDIRSGKRE